VNPEPFISNKPHAGIYVHVPFCVRKCAYCDFYSITDLGLKPAFLAALQSEIAAVSADDLAFDTIYIGGGTPSTLEPGEVRAIVAALHSRFRFESSLEITLESNPGTVDRERLKGFRAAGVNRLTVGVQSFDPANLELLGRVHTAAQAECAVADARAAGFDEIGLDLIYGLPGQSPSAWTADLERALGYAPEHLSCYMLTIEPGTPLGRLCDSGRLIPAADDRVADLFTLTSELLAARGYLHYEIANFARCDTADCADARVSRHNSKYWAYAPYLGFGPAAHSFRPPRRFWNPRSLERYVAAVRAGGPPTAGEEVLTVGQQMTESVMLGLRTSAGLDLADFARRFGESAARACAEAAAPFVDQGLLTRDRSRCAPTRRGMLVHNTIVGEMVERIEECLKGLKLEAVPKVS
jgi:oxygen-independent coproporphyrinogen III oxidase